MNPNSKRLALLGLAAAIVVVAVVGFAATRTTTTSSGSGPDITSPGEQAPSSTSETTPDPPAPDATSTTTAADGSASPPRAAPPVPLDVQVSSTDGLVDGQAVNIHVAPQGGFNAYGAEAFLCRAGTTFLLDADIRPTQTGKCISKPLSAVSNDYVKVAASPPYQGFDITFRVGVGTDSYTMSNGQPVTITCGPGHPCQLVLKLQFTQAFGFQAYPVTYR